MVRKASLRSRDLKEVREEAMWIPGGREGVQAEGTASTKVLR